MKRFATLLLALALGLALSVGAFADTGPKPSVRVELLELPEGRVYGTLLSKLDSTGPANYNPSYYPPDWAEVQDVEIWRAFQNYEDADGFYFLNELWDCSGGELAWTYYPPRDFKLLLYFPDTGEWRVSGIYSQYAFASRFVTDLSQPGELELVRSYNYGGELLGLLARVVTTLAIEVLLALVFGYGKRRALVFIVGVNLATQLTLNLALNIHSYFSGSSMLLFILMELLITVIEAAAYRYELPRRGFGGKAQATFYAVIANLCSCTAGLLL